jgi:glycogen phosphorylase
MRPLRRFRVEPSVPPALAGLTRLAKNLHWTWDAELRSLFERLDPTAWEAANHDPLHTLEHIDTATWERLASDTAVVEAVRAALLRLDEALRSPRWFQDRATSPLRCVAYFSPEFGISETLPQYSGGLGILAGDHLKAASDLGIPLVGIGLLYAEGYFRQRLDAGGLQIERFPRLDPAGLAIVETGVHVSVELAGDLVDVRVWRADVGRIPLLLLDTDVASNSAEGRAVTDRLYGGDVEHRLRQEIVLGIAGVRALRALGFEPQVFHGNEGHAGFSSLERIREYVADGLNFGEAVEAVRAGGVFTTHTPVPAGIDRFPVELMWRYFGEFAQSCGTDIDEILSLGHRDDEDDPRFNMAVMGLRLNARANGVARLHGEVSRSMFSGVWPDIVDDEVPITHVTNGVHARTWVGPAVDRLLTEFVHPVWDGADESTWDRAHSIPTDAIRTARDAGRAELVAFVRSRMGPGVLDPEVLTIGFARRFATYKRATLLLRHPERLRSLLLDHDRPVQFVFAGKAHPADEPGKEMIRQIEMYARQLDVRHRFVFLPDYDMQVARALYHGCDVWLNNPRRPMEACGTSGMKAALNGGLNLSVLDGWWDECFDGDNGWAVPSADDDPDGERRDEREVRALYSLLETEVAPLFYGATTPGRRGTSHVSWHDMVRHAWASLGPRVTASRMVRDYVTSLYEPAAMSVDRLAADDAKGARALAGWKQRVALAWPQLRVTHVEHPETTLDETGVRVGVAVPVRVSVELGGIEASDVEVQVLHGRLDPEGEFLGAPHVDLLVLTSAEGTLAVFEGSYTASDAGPHGSVVRVVPTHPGLAHPLELGRVRWA